MITSRTPPHFWVPHYYYQMSQKRDPVALEVITSFPDPFNYKSHIIACEGCFFDLYGV